MNFWINMWSFQLSGTSTRRSDISNELQKQLIKASFMHALQGIRKSKSLSSLVNIGSKSSTKRSTLWILKNVWKVKARSWKEIGLIFKCHSFLRNKTFIFCKNVTKARNTVIFNFPHINFSSCSVSYLQVLYVAKVKGIIIWLIKLHFLIF